MIGFYFHRPSVLTSNLKSSIVDHLVNFCEAVDEGDRQYVGDENGCHCLKKKVTVPVACSNYGGVRSCVVVSLGKARR